MRKDPRQRTVEILYPIRQIYREYRVRQRRLPVPHQPVVRSIVNRLR
jgi:hypothetical protein